MESKKTQLRKCAQACQKAERKYVTTWKVLTVVALVLALLVSACSVMLALQDNTAMLCGSHSWQVVNKDPKAVRYPQELTEEAERLKVGAELAYQVVAEGSVLLTNNGALPIAGGKKVSLAADPEGLRAALENAGLTVTTAESGADALIVTVSRSMMAEPIAPTYLQLEQKEKDMLAEAAKLKAAGKVKTVILLLHTAYPMQMDFLKNTDAIDACLWIGNVQAAGMNAVADILVGTVNPSGKLADTYSYDIFSAPAMKNPTPISYGGSGDDTYLVCQEGIYIGYKYYETRYEDYVMVADNVGQYQYSDDVAFPFGHGLSYTTFQYSDLAVGYDDTTDQYEVIFAVVNTGKVAGRATVQIYAQTPYTDYDVRYGIEKPAVSLVCFAKTGLLAPGEAEEIVVYVNRMSLASFDAERQMGYILDSGEYYLTMATDSHNAVNNILASKGYDREDGRMDADGDPLMVYHWVESEMDTKTYAHSDSGVQVIPELENADPNRYEGTRGDDPRAKTVTWLSRSNWEGTMPTGQMPNLQLTEAMKADRYDPASYGHMEMPKMGETKTIQLGALMGKPYADPLWNKFLDQLTFEEMVDLLSADFYRNDGETTVKTTAFPGETLLATTFDRELCYRVGLLLGEDLLATETAFVEGPDANVRRIPLDGGNSEDGYLIGELCSETTFGLREKGVHAAIRHVGPNAADEVAVWLSEQTARENYLRSYHRVVEFAGAMSVVLSPARLGAVKADASTELVSNILCGEWGFKGMAFAGGKGFRVESLMAGSTVFSATREELIAVLQTYKNDPVVISAMRDACRRNLYVLVKSAAMNGIGAETIVQSKQQPQVNVEKVEPIYILIPAIFWLLPVVAFLLWQRGKKLWVNTEEYKNYISLLENQKK